MLKEKGVKELVDYELNDRLIYYIIHRIIRFQNIKAPIPSKTLKCNKSICNNKFKN